MLRSNPRRTEKKPTAIDCFAGCGGMTQGLRDAGYRVVGAIEIDQDAASVYRLNHPDTHVWCQDIRELSTLEMLDTLGLRKRELDLLGGCPPCQGFSTLRTLNGGRHIRDAQNELIFEFERLVIGLLPRCVMMENVPGLFEDRRLTRFTRTLETAGYHTETRVLDVADYGVPQRRRRMVFLAALNGPVCFAEPVPNRRTVRDAIGNLPKAGRSGDPLHDIPEKRRPEVMDRIRSIPPDGGSRSALPDRLVLDCHRTSNGFKDVYGRMAWDQPAPTITTGCFNPSKGRYLHPKEHRAITMREAALLQSFPMGYQFPAEYGKVKVATMIGNALPPMFIRRHAHSLVKELHG